MGTDLTYFYSLNVYIFILFIIYIIIILFIYINYFYSYADWLLVSSGLFAAVFALAFAYWADVYHPIKWLAGTLMLQSAACIITVIPSIMTL